MVYVPQLDTIESVSWATTLHVESVQLLSSYKDLEVQLGWSFTIYMENIENSIESSVSLLCIRYAGRLHNSY